MKDNVTLTPSQQKAKELFDIGESLFLTGKAGTGKSFLVSHIINEQQARRRNVVVCAPTGVAAGPPFTEPLGCRFQSSSLIGAVTTRTV